MKMSTTISNSDFKDFINNKYYYVDKTLLIEEIFSKGSEIILLPRPRRFGKTLNLSMLKYFFDIEEDNRDLFKGLKIEKSSIFQNHLNKYPVIFLTLKDIKGKNWNNIYGLIKINIADLYNEHKYLLNSSKLEEYEKNLINKIIKREAEETDYQYSLHKLSEYIYRYYDKKVVILIDEYDTIMNDTYDKEIYDNILNFMRVFIGSTFKGNRYLFKGVITGILRIAKESIFSGANNILIRTILDNDFSDKFGFTEFEVSNMLKYYDLEDNMDNIRNWYNGYTFGNSTIYNPYSIASYVESRELKGHWLGTANDSLIRNLVNKSESIIKDKIDNLIKGEAIEELIEENIVFSELNKPKYLWSLLLFSGYLKATVNYNGKYLLSIPNKEIKIMYNKIREEYFTDIIPELAISMDKISLAILNDDIENFSKEIKNLLMSKLSSYDLGKNKENVYHVIILLSLLRLEYNNNYEVRSNGESGKGRYDISIIPKDRNKTGYIIEIKVAKGEKNLKLKAEEAITQIEEMKYTIELVNKGIKNIRLLGIAFEGKELYLVDKKR